MYPFPRRRIIINYINNYSRLKNGFTLWNFPVFLHFCPRLTYSYNLICCSYGCSFGRASVFVSNRSSEKNVEKKCLFELAPVRIGLFLAVKTDRQTSFYSYYKLYRLCQHGCLATSLEHLQEIFVLL